MNRASLVAALALVLAVALLPSPATSEVRPSVDLSKGRALDPDCARAHAGPWNPGAVFQNGRWEYIFPTSGCWVAFPVTGASTAGVVDVTYYSTGFGTPECSMFTSFGAYGSIGVGTPVRWVTTSTMGCAPAGTTLHSSFPVSAEIDSEIVLQWWPATSRAHAYVTNIAIVSA